jgi:DNA-binding Xre family transcriptional regulator
MPVRTQKITWGEKLKHAREKKGLSQQALADQVHVQQCRLSKIETNNVEWIRTDTLTKLCAVLDVTPNDLMGYDHASNVF